ncbi:MAG TPA: hypothetical protein VF011_05545 [Terriglobales bacterium]
MATKNDIRNPGGEPSKKQKGKRHVEIRPLSTDEINRARAEGSMVIVLPDCCCEIEGGVYGKLIVV